ncbi:MAG: penicillin acylase family protein, partial [Streptosporangiaceae bacterium]
GRSSGSPGAVLTVPAAGQVRIVRDEHGVPHIYARTARALFYGEGYAVGQDRLWQAELLRRTGTGTLAAVPRVGGPSSVRADLGFREYTGGAARLRRLFAGLPKADRIAIGGFSDGMNAWIAAATKAGKLPPEYATIGLKPRPWTPEDVLGTWFAAEIQYGSFGNDEVSNAEQLAAWTRSFGRPAAARIFADTHWLNDPTAPTTIPGRQPARRPIDPGGRRPAGPLSLSPGLLRAVSAQQQAGQTALARAGQGSHWHSNAVLISGRLTRSGAPLLLGGPQAEYSVPQTFMEIGLHGAGYDVTGVTIPGTVAVEIGVGEHGAWTVTSGGTDNSDWYADRISAKHPGRYLFDRRWRPYACRQEIIAVYHQRSRRFTVCDGRHGPVVAESGDTALALKDAGAEGISGTVAGFLRLDTARSLGQFQAALPEFAGSFNFFYAGQGGSIGYWQAGHVPLRAPGDDPFLPHSGTGGDEWRGFLPWRQMPHVINPARGWIANWTTKPEAGWPNSAAGFLDWGPVQRVQALDRQLARLHRGQVTMATLERINQVAGQTAESPVGNELNIAVHELLPRLLRVLRPGSDRRLRAAAALLAGWNGQRTDRNHDGRYHRPAVAIWQAWYPAFVDHVFARELGTVASGDIDSSMLTNLAVRLLEGRSASRPLHYHYLHGQPPWQAATSTLRSTLAALTVRYHSADMARWLLPVVRTRWQPLGLGHVASTPWMNRGTYNQVVQAGPGRALTAVNVDPPGESGLAGSPYLADQLRLYATWRYKPMRLTMRALRGHVTSDIVLTVG